MIAVTKFSQNVMEDLTMKLKKSLLLYVMITTVSALNDTRVRDCSLVIPEEVHVRPEPQPEDGNLLIYVYFSIIRLGDVPDSGGSYGVDLL